MRSQAKGKTILTASLVAILGASAFLLGKAKADDAPKPAGSAKEKPAELPLIRGELVPREASKKPTKDEWKEAKPVRANRNGLEGCELLLVREWLRVTCKRASGASLVAGDPKGVEIFMAGSQSFWADDPTRAVITLPLVRGQSLLISVLDLSFDYDSTSLGEGGTMSVLWREGQEDPVIVLLPVPD